MGSYARRLDLSTAERYAVIRAAGAGCSLCGALALLARLEVAETQDGARVVVCEACLTGSPRRRARWGSAKRRRRKARR